MSDPKGIRVPLDQALSHRCTAIDLQLRDRSIVENLAIDADGIVLGKIVGGHDGVDETPLPFKQENIMRYRFRALAAQFGTAKWQKL